MKLVKSDEASYLSPQSVHYAGMTFDELPPAYKQAFKKYRLTVIKLRELGELRLETFRRINRGGEPLSGQDIRLAYYGEGSPSVQLIRLAGIYDRNRSGARRFLEAAKTRFGIEELWRDDEYETWHDYWEGRELARGQTPSEMFLWSMVAVQTKQLSTLLSDAGALAALRFSYDRSADGAMDAFCAQLQYQDRNPHIHNLFMPFEKIRDEFFPFFSRWLHVVIGVKGTTLSVTKYRLVGAIIGAAFTLGLKPETVGSQGWSDIVEFIRSPRTSAEIFGIDLPASKGRWDGPRGYGAQLEAIRKVLGHVANAAATPN